MNFSEAIESLLTGPYNVVVKRKNWIERLSIGEGGHLMIMPIPNTNSGIDYNPTIEDIRAEDWEIKYYSSDASTLNELTVNSYFLKC